MAAFLRLFLKQGIGQIAWSLAVFGHVRGNVWIEPLGMLRIGGRSFRLPLCIPDSKYFATSQNYSCDRHLYEILGNWNSLLIIPLPLLSEVSFTSVHVLICDRELCPCLCIQWAERHKGWEWWEVASGEKPLSKMTFKMCVRGLFLIGRTVSHCSCTGKGVFVE